jgi:uncharacterized protein
MITDAKRINIVDILRGFAIVSILLLHNIEHFDFHYTAEGIPPWMVSVDKGIWDTLMFLFSGKSYAIFALLFGITYYIQTERQNTKGYDFRLRFAWRMLLLLGFGMINSCFYQGDILSIYALVGFFLIPFTRCSNRTVLIAAILFMLQPYELYKIAHALVTPGLTVVKTSYFKETIAYLSQGSFTDVVIGNTTIGKPAILLWSWDKGRIFQTLSLFLLGMLAGRTSIFLASEKNKRFWIKILVISSIAFAILFTIQNNISSYISYKALSRPLSTVIKSWSNASFMFVLLSGIVLFSYSRASDKILHVFIPFGRMSLSNYFMQSIIGSFIYYGFGLGLYKYTGSTYCLLIGLFLAVLQWLFCLWWLKKHDKGPLEIIWHKLTWIKAR